MGFILRFFIASYRVIHPLYYPMITIIANNIVVSGLYLYIAKYSQNLIPLAVAFMYIITKSFFTKYSDRKKPPTAPPRQNHKTLKNNGKMKERRFGALKPSDFFGLRIYVGPQDKGDGARVKEWGRVKKSVHVKRPGRPGQIDLSASRSAFARFHGIEAPRYSDSAKPLLALCQEGFSSYGPGRFRGRSS